MLCRLTREHFELLSPKTYILLPDNGQRMYWKFSWKSAVNMWQKKDKVPFSNDTTAWWTQRLPGDTVETYETNKSSEVFTITT